MPGRSFALIGYRYRFGGHEKLNEVSGSGNTVDMGDRWLDVRLGRTPKMDAKAHKYPSVSPHAYVLNNPIVYIDREGKEVYIHGMDVNKAVVALQRKTSLQLSYDVETGKLTAMGTSESDLDKELMKAITDIGIKVNLYTTNENSFKSRDGSI